MFTLQRVLSKLKEFSGKGSFGAITFVGQLGKEIIVSISIFIN